MHQLTQQLKSGQMEIIDAPFPILLWGQVLVRNHFSVISPGTEGKTVSDARKGYIAKARSRQKEVKQVIGMMKSEGPKKTYDLVMNKLEAPSALGYSCAGEVIAVGGGVNDLKVGDLVACGGSGAVHADIVGINRNLCVKVPEGVDLGHASLATIASIAIQGIRQADLRFGENCTVIGLGLIGLLTIQILKAAGIKAIGVDINKAQVEKAKENGANLALCRNTSGIAHTIVDFTRGHGTDAAIITAGTSSLDPVEFAGEICRKKGKVIIVGAVPTGFSRSNYYKKELDLRMSSSYGPGRYDPNYEEKGIDYPIAYVRFTENRNMETYIDLLDNEKLNIEKLISHRFSLFDAPKAYDLVVSRKENVSGILIEYDTDIPENKISFRRDKSEISHIDKNIGFIGAGNFAQNAVLPRIKNKFSLIGLASIESNQAHYVKKKYAFEYCTESPEELLNDENIGTVFILTRHDTHAEYIIKALEAGKNVYVEKPLALNYDELIRVGEAYNNASKKLMLGFNRRFSPLIQELQSIIPKEQKKSINIRVNAGVVPPSHWVHDPDTGGGRIIGEACHFIDLAGFLANSTAVGIHAFKLESAPDLSDTLTINISYKNGCIATICYYSNGNKNLPKERIEVFSNETVCLIDDFRVLTYYSGNKKRKIKLKSQDKGHTHEFEALSHSLEKGQAFPIPFDEIYESTRLSFEVIKSIKENRAIDLKD